MAYAESKPAGGLGKVRRASGISVLLGGWLLVSPFLLWTGDHSHWNDILVGVAVLLFSGLRFITPRRSTRWLSWLNVLLGLWLVFAPFVLGYLTPRATWNDVVTGVLLASLGLWSATHPSTAGTRR